MESSLAAWAQHSLSNHLYENAVFLAERLCAEAPSEASRLLLANAYYASDQPSRACAVLSASSAGANRYLLALCHVKLGRMVEAQRALLGSAVAADPDATAPVPNGAAGLYLLGTICLKSQPAHVERQRAIKYFSRALEMNPFLWSAYEALSQLGAPMPAAPPRALPPNPEGCGLGASMAAGGCTTGRAYGPSAATGASGLAAVGAGDTPVRSFDSLLTPSEVMSPPSGIAPPGSLAGPGSMMPPPCQHGQAASSTTCATPAVAALQISTPPGASAASPPPTCALHSASLATGLSAASAGGNSGLPPSALPSPNVSHRRRAPPRATPAASASGVPASGGWSSADMSTPTATPMQTDDPHTASSVPGRGASAAPPPIVARRGRERPTANSSIPPASAGAVGPTAVVRRSSRLSAGGKDTDAAPPVHSPHARRATTHAHVVPSSEATSAAGTTEGAARAVALLRQLALAFRLLCQFRCADAIREFSALPAAHYATGWVLTQVGRAYYEMVQYPEALRTFEQVQKIEPHRLEGSEIHSTILWHLKREKALCYLAKRSIELDRTSPHSCCVIGNCFSLQKEHDVAIKFFSRAIQLRPDFAYAHTLCGHEHTAKDDWEKAMVSYRTAIRYDERHYNAWYGLGNVYFRQEKFDFAEHHFRKALAINPGSSPLYCYLGMSLHANGKTRDALEMLKNAIAVDPRNPLARYQKAHVLIAMDEHEAALAELLLLLEVAPKEGSVHFTLGKVYKRLGQTQPAMVHMTRALDLSPKDAQQVKAALLNLEREDHADDEEEL